MRFLKHLVRLLGDFASFAWQNKAWWIVPIILVLLLLAGLITVTGSVAPYLYTFF